MSCRVRNGHGEDGKMAKDKVVSDTELACSDFARRPRQHDLSNHGHTQQPSKCDEATVDIGGGKESTMKLPLSFFFPRPLIVIWTVNSGWHRRWQWGVGVLHWMLGTFGGGVMEGTGRD
ncbi:unnamed protein product [Prunus armeniaca]|uniref:Uncharacterized protein n=1 Tax=Prunus armeniaca TaxID=36596 RepID=A0A6J5XCT8_PRUAR|nr:unnamed protein product [Prunus armeniaca]